MRYWGYRIDNDSREFFYDEIKQGRLRQGWGYNDNQDLRRGENTDITARRNFPIYNKVKKGDYLLIPHIETWEEIVIVQAIEDFDKGYIFSIPKCGDYGHIFPVKYIKRFSRQNINVEGNIRETFKCRSRFWNIDRCEDEIKTIIERDEADLISKSGFRERFRRKVEAAFDEESFSERVYEELKKTSEGPEWEYILCEGFKTVFPDSYSIQTTSNAEEKKHGADIIIKMPGILDVSYIIAIQVKDYKDVVGDYVIEQITKSDEYFRNENEILIDKYLIIIRADKDINNDLMEKAEKAGVKVLFDRDLKRLLTKMAKAFLSDTIAE